MSDKIKVGLFGFGVVGGGIYKVLTEKKRLSVEVSKIVIKDPNKKRDAPEELFTTDATAILDDTDIDLVVELIDDADAAYEIVKQAMNNGKSVVSANKKMVAHHHTELIELSKEKNVSFLYEAAVCGSVPIIRNLEEYFDNDLITHIKGIVNGSTNYILSSMLTRDETYEDALDEAQKNGFAESNPTLDVEGFDAAYKLSILSLHAFGKHINHDKILKKGITSLSPLDFQFAKEKDFVIKLIAKCHIDASGELKALTVLPTFIDSNSSLGHTDNEFNGVLVGSTLADEQFFYGKGAGRFPTSSAVLSDISAFRYGYKYEYKKGFESYEPQNDIVSKFYIGFNNHIVFDSSIFDEIFEKYVNKTHSYMIGTASINKLAQLKILENPNLSVIRFDE